MNGLLECMRLHHDKAKLCGFKCCGLWWFSGQSTGDYKPEVLGLLPGTADVFPFFFFFFSHTCIPPLKPVGVNTNSRL